MGIVNLNDMRKYLEKSISSLNQNKLNGILAEINFREYLDKLGYGDRVSPGGWIVRSTGEGEFGHNVSVFFPQTIQCDVDYNDSNLIDPPRPLHTICATMHQIGIKSYFCLPNVKNNNDTKSVSWYVTQLGIPFESPYRQIKDVCDEFQDRQRNYNFLRYKTDTTSIPDQYIPDQFTKENLRVSFANSFLSEISDIDGVLWGQQYTYPIEIKEKTEAPDNRLGPYFGLDLGPFVKLAYYAAKKGNMHSIFVVREIDNIEDRNLVQWWYITYDTLASFASWVPGGGGPNMGGGRSTVVRIPKSEFLPLTPDNISKL